MQSKKENNTMKQLIGLLTGSFLALVMLIGLEIATQTHEIARCWTQMDKQDKSMLMEFITVALED